jgi:cytoskeletal protein RodZ
MISHVASSRRREWIMWAALLLSFVFVGAIAVGAIT